MSTALQAEIRTEIQALHRFFVDWFVGKNANTDAVFKQGFLGRFDEQFLLIPPGGVLLDLATLAEGIRTKHGSNPDFRIAIRNVVVRRIWGHHILATYEEWQRNALASKPPDNGRLATVLFDHTAGLSWLHVHETWLPEAAMQSGPYDF